MGHQASPGRSNDGWLRPDALIDRAAYPDLGDAWWRRLVRDADLTIGKRALVAAPFFAGVAALFVVAGGIAGQWAAVLVTAPLVATIVRTALLRNVAASYDRDPRRWRRILVTTMLINAACWSGFVVVLALTTGLSWVTLVALICAVGLAAGVMTTLHPNLRLLRVILLALSIPVLGVFITMATREGFVLAGLVAVQLGYYVLTSERVYREYWAGAIGRARLEVRDQTNTLLSTAIHRAADGIEVRDAERRLEYVNPAYEKIVGVPAAALMGTVDPAIEARDTPWTGEVRGIDANGDQYVHQLTTWPVKSSTGRTRNYVSVRRDVTQQQQLQAQLQRSSRDASMGVMAASVAHDINNPLTYVIGNACYVRDALGYAADPKVLEALDEVVEGATRIAAIVQDLKTMSRPPDEVEQVLDLADVLRVAINISSNELRHRARLHQQLEPMPSIEAPSAKLTMVFVNLLVNAAHAITEGSASANEITVATGTDSDGWARVEISDTGAGIAPQHLEKIFDPFFTTKAAGIGTGLGLPICRRTIEDIGGTITVNSKLGVGTRVVVRVPPASLRDRDDPSAKIAATATDPQTARVLVIDDERHVARAVARLLRPHLVTTAASPQEVRAHLADCPFDVVLCDVMMPDGGGESMHQLIRETCPGLERRVIFMTGGAFTGDAKSFLDRLHNPVLQKPFDPVLLFDLVERCAAGELA